MFTEIKIIKMCTYVIDHTPNGYYYAFINMREILCLRQGKGESTKSYYRRFEEDISTSEIKQFTPTTHIELNKTYTGGDNDNRTKRLKLMCLPMSDHTNQY